ncbi:MAG: MBL fold metallo-hydrolase [Anaerolineales bacterium]|nr:MBL fold metallo-hydrolase [Anaerolineales bacterium]NUQ83508.1 MBL fold metallo-hydrolase [Anaerolineales bacterium]
MTENATYATFETSGGATIHRLPLEVFPNFWAYVYLVAMDDLRVLIDSGSGTEASHKNLLEGFDQAGIRPGDLTHILLTHAHIDHYGGLRQLKPLTNARIGVHELDAQTVAHHEARLALTARRIASFLADAGLAEETRDSLLDIYRFTKILYQSVPVDFTFESLGMNLGPFEMIHLPGHCPGHVAIRLHDYIFCGDMVVEGVIPHLAPESIYPHSGLDHYLDSLARFQRWTNGAWLILNGHNDAFTDLSARIEATRGNLVRRMRRALEALGEPLTAVEICRAIYGEAGGYNLLLILEKTGAYVEYLYEHGMIEIVNANEVEQGLPARYRRLLNEDALLSGIERKVNAYTSTQVNR